jgi:hypothetical protein
MTRRVLRINPSFQDGPVIIFNLVLQEGIVGQRRRLSDKPCKSKHNLWHIKALNIKNPVMPSC